MIWPPDNAHSNLMVCRLRMTEKLADGLNVFSRRMVGDGGWAARAAVSRNGKNGHAMALRHLVGVRNPKLFAKAFGVGIKGFSLWIKVGHVESGVTHADISKKSGVEDMGPGDH